MKNLFTFFFTLSEQNLTHTVKAQVAETCDCAEMDKS